MREAALVRIGIGLFLYPMLFVYVFSQCADCTTVTISSTQAYSSNETKYVCGKNDTCEFHRGLNGTLSSDNVTGVPQNLRRLNLSGNLLTGISGPFWNTCSSLISLDLSSNNFSGDIMLLLKLNHSQGISSLVNLTNLYLSEDHLSGQILDLSTTKLSVLDLSNNQFSNNFSLMINWTALVLLDLSGNMLDESFHGNLSKASSLESLKLANNRFTKPLAISGLHNLTTLDLSHNLLGSIPDIMNMTSLEVLDLSNNNFSGIIPSNIISSQNLKVLNLSVNSFSGTIPPAISGLHNLTTLDLSHNNLLGSIPDIMNMTSLEVLDLSHNNLTGNIPIEWQTKLRSLKRFNFSYNAITVCKEIYQINESAFAGTPRIVPCSYPNVGEAAEASNDASKIAISVAVPILFLMLVAICFAFVYKRRTRLWKSKLLTSNGDYSSLGPYSFQTESTEWGVDVKLATSIPVVIIDKPLLNFTFADLMTATSQFDRGTLLSEGSTGLVYSGFLQEGVHVAIEVLTQEFTVTNHEMASKIERLGRIKHCNLVPLIGYCFAGKQKIIIYEYMENGTLQSLLHNLPLGNQTLDDLVSDGWEDDPSRVNGMTNDGKNTWKFRHKIALGVARGLAFLHHGCSPQIVHGDVKASSILLDSEFEPKLSIYGLNKLAQGIHGIGSANASPDVTLSDSSDLETCSLTPELDVYCFGIVLFELITGKKPIDDEYQDTDDANLVSWVRRLMKTKKLSNTIDVKIRGTGLDEQMEEALRIGYLCTAEKPSKRPTMKQVIGLLKDIEPNASSNGEFPVV